MLHAGHCVSPIDRGDARCITDSYCLTRVMHGASPGSGLSQITILNFKEFPWLPMQ
ncbi:hypothetical protein GFS60_07042 (plasmid) [Rhodococcus sp. WAY2]|nr:hypothetical protein GFS60_07042 [Rhodococcus sp. WAY2]